MIKKIKQLIFITAMFVLAMPDVILAEDPSLPPILISGTVTIDGSIALNGVVSVVGGQIATPITANISDTGKYSIPVPDENNEKELTFKVNGEIATLQIVTSPTQIVDLSITTQDDSNYGGGGGTSGGGGTTPPVSTPTPTLPSSEETPKTPIVKGVSDATVVDGDIIQAKSSANPFAVYIVKVVGDTKYIRHIVSLEIFNHYGHLKWENLKQVDSLDEYSLSGWVRVNTGPNGTPGPNDKVYEINGDQTRHWINMTAEQFLTHGGSEQAIFSVNQGELDLYTIGVDIIIL